MYMTKAKKLNLSKELLVDLYTNYTVLEISKLLGVSEKTIRRRFKEYNINTKGVHTNPQFIKKVLNEPKKPKIKKICKYKDKDDFLKVYKNTKSLVLVAKHYGISPDTALKWKHRHNIDTILGVSEEGRNSLNKNKPYTNKEWLQQAYKNNTMQQIADSLGVNVCTIKYWIKYFNIPTRSVAEQRAFTRIHHGKTYYSKIIKGFSRENYMNNIPYNLPHTLKTKIINSIGKCQCCGYTEVLDLHHKDGNHHNNLPSNHVILCPNCHAKVHRLNCNLDTMLTDTTQWIDILSYQNGH